MRNIQGVIRLAILCVVLSALFHVDALHAKEPKRPVDGPLITIHTPHPEQLEIALDEIELEWTASGDETSVAAKSPIVTYGSRVVKSEPTRAIIGVSWVTSPIDLPMIAGSLKAANPGAEAHLILYEPGFPRNAATRRLLTREVGVVLDPGEDPQRLLADVPLASIRSIAGVPGGYVVEANDPMAALNLADAIRGRPGVRSAYPLLKRVYDLR